MTYVGWRIAGINKSHYSRGKGITPRNPKKRTHCLGYDPM